MTGPPKHTKQTTVKTSGGIYLCQGLNSHYFHIIGDGHQPNSRGLYTHYKDSLLKVGGPIPQKNATTLTMAHLDV